MLKYLHRVYRTASTMRVSVVTKYYFVVLLQICRRHSLYPVLRITQSLKLVTEQSLALSAMLMVIQHQPIYGWILIQTKLQVDEYTPYQQQESTVYSVQQVTTSRLLTAASYHSACLHDTTSAVGCITLCKANSFTFYMVVHDKQSEFHNHGLVAVLVWYSLLDVRGKHSQTVRCAC